MACSWDFLANDVDPTEELELLYHKFKKFEKSRINFYWPFCSSFYILTMV